MLLVPLAVLSLPHLLMLMVLVRTKNITERDTHNLRTKHDKQKPRPNYRPTRPISSLDSSIIISSFIIIHRRGIRFGLALGLALTYGWNPATHTHIRHGLLEYLLLRSLYLFPRRLSRL